MDNYWHNSDECIKYKSREKKGSFSKCFRCLTFVLRDSVHRASTCTVLKGPSVNGPRRCAGCFLYLYKGARIHPNDSFSKDCVFKAATMLVMSFWGKTEGVLRSKLMSDLLGVEHCTDEDFGAWLVQDSVQKHPGIVQAFRWVLAELDLPLV